MFTKSSLTEHPVRVKIATRAQTEQFALLSEQHCVRGLIFLFSANFLNYMELFIAQGVCMV